MPWNVFNLQRRAQQQRPGTAANRARTQRGRQNQADLARQRLALDNQYRNLQQTERELIGQLHQGIDDPTNIRLAEGTAVVGITSGGPGQQGRLFRQNAFRARNNQPPNDHANVHPHNEYIDNDPAAAIGGQQGTNMGIEHSSNIGRQQQRQIHTEIERPTIGNVFHDEVLSGSQEVTLATFSNLGRPLTEAEKVVYRHFLGRERVRMNEELRGESGNQFVGNSHYQLKFPINPYPSAESEMDLEKLRPTQQQQNYLNRQTDLRQQNQERFNKFNSKPQYTSQGQQTEGGDAQNIYYGGQQSRQFGPEFQSGQQQNQQPRGASTYNAPGPVMAGADSNMIRNDRNLFPLFQPAQVDQQNQQPYQQFQSGQQFSSQQHQMQQGNLYNAPGLGMSGGSSSGMISTNDRIASFSNQQQIPQDPQGRTYYSVSQRHAHRQQLGDQPGPTEGRGFTVPGETARLRPTAQFSGQNYRQLLRDEVLAIQGDQGQVPAYNEQQGGHIYNAPGSAGTGSSQNPYSYQREELRRDRINPNNQNYNPTL